MLVYRRGQRPAGLDVARQWVISLREALLSGSAQSDLRLFCHLKYNHLEKIYDRFIYIGDYVQRADADSKKQTFPTSATAHVIGNDGGPREEHKSPEFIR